MSTTPTLRAPFTIDRVVDTRDYIEDGDRFVPVAGSGDARPCDRCGRHHEIHAHVTDATGTPAVVGTGCMDATASVARHHASVARRAARDAARQRAADEAAGELARLRVIALAARPFDRDAVVKGGTPERPEWRLGDCVVRGFATSNEAERLGCLQGMWDDRRLADACGGPDAYRRLRTRAAW